ncbi:MAG: hypothetical protein QM724_06070 [Flavobacteriales bacterium]
MTILFRSTCSLLLCMLALRSVAQAGQLDNEFGTNGITTLELPGTDSFKASGLAIAPDGAMYVCGTAIVAGSPQFCLARFLSTGMPDLDFNGTGFLLLDVSGMDDEASAVTMAGDDRVLVAGTSAEFWNNTSWITVAVVKADGLLDTDLGDGTGIIHTVLDAGRKATGHAIVGTSDGGFVVGGSAERIGGDQQALVVRYNANGTVNDDFGEHGISCSGQGMIGPGYFRESINALVVTPDGDIVAAGDCDVPGFQGQRAYKLRLHKDGSATSFASGPFSWGGPSRSRGIARQDDGHYLLIGETDAGGSVMAYQRCDSDGVPEISNEVWFVDEGPRNSTGYAVAVDLLGHPLLAGSVIVGSGAKAFCLMRLRSDCGNDDLFGTGGQVITPVGGWAEARAIGVQADGKIDPGRTCPRGRARSSGHRALPLGRQRGCGRARRGDG